MAKRKDSLALFEVFGRKPQMPTGIAIPPTPAQTPPTKPPQLEAPAEPPATSAAEPHEASQVDSSPAVSGVEPSVTSEVQPPAITNNVELAATQQSENEYVPPVASEVEPPAVSEVEPPAATSQPWDATPAERNAQGLTRQLSLTMTQLQWALSGGAAIVLLVCVFVLGRVSAPKPQVPGPIEPAAGANVAGAKTGSGVGETGAPGERIVGKFYLVIQGINGKTDKNFQEAHAIVAFLKDSNVRADVREMSDDKGYLVWSMDPLDSDSVKDPKTAAYVKRIEDLGKKYMPKGNYDFRQKPGTEGKVWCYQARPEK